MVLIQDLFPSTPPPPPIHSGRFGRLRAGSHWYNKDLPDFALLLSLFLLPTPKA
ncbi:hypothetical protein I79_011722 [Cricetulus griseus]|uniref:Uncharacterized protein n=1 Tax=Cricetulus griseus TaxID=10029 RepID=G3HLX8_CRIGR|nr:hypothetical protein I79_011722 [Cricetulus griseus]